MAIQCCFERYEKKYCLTLSQQRFLLERMTPYMKKDAYGEYTICNIYYDTDDYRLIRASLEKPVYKEKLRVRSYGVPQEDGKVFVELKKKFDGVVYKRRITTGIQNMERFSPVSCRVKTSARSDARSAIFSRFITPCPKSSSATTGSPLRASTIRSSASRSTRTYGGATRMSTSASATTVHPSRCPAAMC